MFVQSNFNGDVLIAGADSYLYKSTNYGQTWVQTTAPKNSWNNVAFDSTGQNLVASAGYSQYSKTGGLFTSANAGTTWTQLYSADTSLDWASVGVDSTGKKIVGAVTNGAIFESSDGGKTFLKSPSAPSTLAWKSVVSSASGNNIVAISDGSTGLIYTKSV
eukprot:gene24814-31196_t